MSGPPDLRQALREKAAGHSSYYRRLRAAAAPAMAAVSSQVVVPAGAACSCPATVSSDDDERRPVERPRSRDSAVDLDDAPSPTVLTDAIRNLSEDKTCYDSGGENAFDEPNSSPYDRREYCEEHGCYHIRSKIILEAQYVDCPPESYCEESDVFEGGGNIRRPSALSWDGDEGSRVRKVRTPSVVVSDYSDDIHAGITLEELEYFRSHVEAGSTSSGRSSCSNLDSRCGSQLSVLDLEDSRCGSHLSVIDLEESKNGLSPPVSDFEDDDSGLERQQSPKKITIPH